MSASITTLPEVDLPFAWREDRDLVWLEAKVGSATAAFSTRLGGVSDGPYRSLNLGVLAGDERTRVHENRRALAGALGRDPDSVVMGRQVHGTGIQLRRTASNEIDFSPAAKSKVMNGRFNASNVVSPAAADSPAASFT